MTFKPYQSIPIQGRIKDTTGSTPTYIEFTPYTGGQAMNSLANGKGVFSVMDRNTGAAVSTTVEGATVELTNIVMFRHSTVNNRMVYTIAEGLPAGQYCVYIWYVKDNVSNVREDQEPIYGEFDVVASRQSKTPPST